MKTKKQGITRKKFDEIFEDEDYQLAGGCSASQGLAIIAKYIDPKKKTLLTGAQHDVIYSVDVDDLIDAGITQDDTQMLRNLNWMIEDDEGLALFV